MVDKSWIPSPRRRALPCYGCLLKPGTRRISLRASFVFLFTHCECRAIPVCLRSQRWGRVLLTPDLSGYHMSLDFRTLDPKPFMEIFPTTIPIDQINHRVVLDSGDILRPPPRPRVADYPQVRPSYETAAPVDL